MESAFLAITALITAGYQVFFFLIAVAFRFDKFTDFAGGSNFTVLAITTFVLKGSVTYRQVVLTLLVVIWSLRESLYLLFRIFQWGEDWRYDKIRNSLKQLVIFWTGQSFWVWIVSLPVTLANASNKNPDLQVLDVVGWSLWLLGFFIEVISDIQKFKFKKDPANSGKWCNIGLWKLSRHPNYFGEIVIWWGMFIASLPLLDNLYWLSVASPLFTMFILLFVSGMNILEISADKKNGSSTEYRQYKHCTSPLIILPQGVYGSLPTWFKRVFLFELALYNRRSDGKRKSK